MIINSLVTSFIPVALLVLQYESNTVQPGIGRNLKQSVKKVCLVAFTSVLLNLMLKVSKSSHGLNLIVSSQT